MNRLTIKSAFQIRKSYAQNFTINALYSKFSSLSLSGGSDSYLEGSDNFEELINANIHRFGIPSRRKRHTTYKFTDKAFIEVRGGKGGNGCISFQYLDSGRKRSSGGNGGTGGSVYVVADDNVKSLDLKLFHFNGGHGTHGQGDGKTGKSGESSYIKVPVGTIVTERFCEDFQAAMVGEFDFENSDVPIGIPVVELDKHNDTLLVAEGGKPGIGNKTHKSSLNRGASSLPMHSVPGHDGETRWLLLELKLIADVGLIGFPNAGKSSLLNVLSKANPTIAPYPFTTLHPMVGTVEYSDMNRITVADIPGIIKGSHLNRGLGLEFLRHIERTKVMVYIIDAAATESRNPVEDLICLVDEIKKYNEEMIYRPSLVFGNKFDCKVDGRHLNSLKRYSDSLGWSFFYGSAHTGDGIAQLANELRYMVTHRKSSQLLV